ncbi:MAG: hypothetical protein J7K22_00670 [Nanoarchaeota archaeon]|nr:hypothetical protein [Nanoarchaeota archaeon]
MNLKEFSNMVKEIINQKISLKTLDFLKELPQGETNYVFGFLLEENSVRILSSVRSMPTIFQMLKNIMHVNDYNYSIRIITQDGKAKILTKTAVSYVDDIKKELLLGEKVNRVMYEKITTEKFEITFSEYEGTIVKFKEKEQAEKIFQIIVGLFPFIELEKDNKKVKVTCKFNKKENNVTLDCIIEIDGKGIGTKRSIVVLNP